MNKCTHPDSLQGYCARTAPCIGDACEWATAQIEPVVSDGTALIRYETLEQWTHAEETPDILTSPCGRFEVVRIRITILSRRYSAWDKYPSDGDGLPALAGVFDSAKAALRCINGIKI